MPALAAPAAVVGALGVFASARLYVVPGRPAWHSPLTVVRFYATALATGPALTDHLGLAALGAAVSIAATVASWARLWRRDEQPWRGSVLLELRWFRPWTALRLALAVVGAGLALAGVPLAAVVLLVASEVIARWLFFVTVVPLNIPGSFWRHTQAGQR